MNVLMNGKTVVEKYLSLAECKNNFLYYIDARNAHIGIFRSDRKSFDMIWNSFGELYIGEEDHWDYNKGTVKPIQELCEVPVFDSYSDELNYLINQTKIFDTRKENK